MIVIALVLKQLVKVLSHIYAYNAIQGDGQDGRKNLFHVVGQKLIDIGSFVTNLDKWVAVGMFCI